MASEEWIRLYAIAKEINEALDTHPEDGYCGSIGVLTFNEVSNILMKYGWKPTNMKNNKKPLVQIEIAWAKYFSADYTIFYNSKFPKQLAIVSVNVGDGIIGDWLTVFPSIKSPKFEAFKLEQEGLLH